MCGRDVFVQSGSLLHTGKGVISQELLRPHPQPAPKASLPAIRAAPLSLSGVVLNAQLRLNLHLELSAVSEGERALTQGFNRPQTNYVNFTVRKGRD